MVKRSSAWHFLNIFWKELIFFAKCQVVSGYNPRFFVNNHGVSKPKPRWSKKSNWHQDLTQIWILELQVIIIMFCCSCCCLQKIWSLANHHWNIHISRCFFGSFPSGLLTMFRTWSVASSRAMTVSFMGSSPISCASWGINVLGRGFPRNIKAQNPREFWLKSCLFLTIIFQICWKHVLAQFQTATSQSKALGQSTLDFQGLQIFLFGAKFSIILLPCEPFSSPFRLAFLPTISWGVQGKVRKDNPPHVLKVSNKNNLDSLNPNNSNPSETAEKTQHNWLYLSHASACRVIFICRTLAALVWQRPLILGTHRIRLMLKFSFANLKNI